MKFLRALIKIVSVILVISLTVTAIFFRKNGVNVISLKSSDDIRAESISASVPENRYEKIASSGYLEMYFDRITTAVMIKETVGGKKWYAMPEGTDSAIVSMTVRTADGVHYMDSYRNSTAFSASSYQLRTDGVKLRYIMADDKTTAQKTEFIKSDIAFCVNIYLALRDGNFFVNADIENLSGNEKCAVTDFSVLEYFGAFKNPASTDFLLIPDGCGAVSYPFNESGDKEYSCRVYGSDTAVKNDGAAHALVGAFGMKNGSSAFAAIIGESEEFAYIKAVSSKNGVSRVYADFAFDYSFEDGKSLYVYKNEKPSVSVCYKFLPEDNATYSDIALACREQLIRNGVLSTSMIENSDDVPVSLIFTGAVKGGRWSLGYDEYTTFSQAEDMIKRIKAKGVNNLSVRYNGVFENNSQRIIPSLGGKKGLENLASYAKSQNVKLFIDLNILTYDSTFGSADFSAARSMKKTPFDVEIQSGIGQSRKCKYRTVESTRKYVDSVIKAADEYDISGFCIEDAGRILSSDFSAAGAKRSEYKNTVASQLSALSGEGEIMVEVGNSYTVKSAGTVINMPMGVLYDESTAYEAIPFVQSVFHGASILSSEPINTAENSKTAMLKSIEYGLCPVFTLTYSKPSGVKGRIKFDDAANDVIDYYNEISKALDSLEGERIINHDKLKDGVYCTAYSNSVRIYVNYTDKDAAVNGVTVPSNGFIRIG